MYPAERVVGGFADGRVALYADDAAYAEGMVNLPSGTVTFVFTDIEGSTRLLKQAGDTEYATLLAVHRRLVRDIFASHDGHEIDTQGDAFFYSFVRARQAVAAAIELQRAHAKASWPGGLTVRVRAGLHTGEPAVGDEGYTGIDVVRAARIAALGTGGQVLLSDTTRAIAGADLPDGVRLRALGERKLKDIDRAEPLWALAIEGLDEAVAEGGGTDVESADSKGPSAFRDLIGRARERIEARVLSELEQELPGMVAGSPRPPPPAPHRSLSREITRLHKLREDGALTEEQYRRMVDRLVDGDGDLSP
jgi:class 3 adenylate cyclase